jgi:hypothetical protein
MDNIIKCIFAVGVVALCGMQFDTLLFVRPLQRTNLIHGSCSTRTLVQPSVPIPNNSTTPCRTTLVTVYFEIGGGKHQTGEYEEWIEALREAATCLVVFTDRPELWRDGRVFVIEADLCAEGLFLNHTWSFWRRQWFVDPEAAIHKGYLLYLIWNLKPRFLLRATELNPFHSDHFFYVDAGYAREKGLADTRGPPRLSGRKGVRVLQVGAYPAEERRGHFRYTVGQDRIGGGMFGGRAEDIRGWHDLYYGTMADYVKRGWFVGKEQNVMATLCAEHRHACVRIRPYGFPFFWGNIWFSMWNCLFGSTPYVEEED